jgi:putative transcriptional regulator
MQTRIREWRQALGFTQEQLAEIVGVTRQTILFLEKSTYNPSLRLACKIALILNKSVEELFSFEDEEPKMQRKQPTRARLTKPQQGNREVSQ